MPVCPMCYIREAELVENEKDFVVRVLPSGESAVRALMKKETVHMDSDSLILDSCPPSSSGQRRLAPHLAVAPPRLASHLALGLPGSLAT